MERKVAIVTGGSRGIGEAICLKFASKGIDVVVNYTSSEEKANKVVEKCVELGVKAIAIKADVSKIDECEAMIKAVSKEFGKIDILVNNAGITKDNLILLMSEDEFDSVIDINLKGAFNCMKHVSRLMLKKRYGRIINISSVVGEIGNSGQVNYSASKAGLIGMTKSLARELAVKGITVNAVAPGFIKSDMTENLGEDATEALVKTIPMGSLGEPEDIANAVYFLASDDARYITGQVIGVNGGMSM